MKHILACIDFSPVTEAVLEQTRNIALLAGAEVRLLHVAMPDPDFVGFEAGPDAARVQRARALRDEHRHIEHLAESLRAEGVAASSLMVQGATVETILEQSGRFAADLVVVGSHGHGALHQLLAGSVTRGVLKKSAVPVLVVPDARAHQPERD